MSAPNQQIDWMHWIYRLIAIIIDGIIIAIPTAIIGFIITLIMPLTFETLWYYTWGSWIINVLIEGVLLLLYFVLLELLWGATIGKRILGLRVQTVDGQRVTFVKSFIRNVSKVLGPLIILDWLIGIVTEGDKRQKFTDRIAGTTVISTKDVFNTAAPPPPPPPPPT